MDTEGDRLRFWKVLAVELAPIKSARRLLPSLAVGYEQAYHLVQCGYLLTLELPSAQQCS